MPGFVVGGGKIDPEGFLKIFLMGMRTGYATGLNATQRGAGANMSVDVNINSSGYAGGLLNTSANVPYVGWIAATENVTVNTSDPTNPRIDTLVAYVDLSVISTGITDNTGAFKFKAVAGTPAGSPSAPSGATIQASIGAGNPYITIANIAVAASASSIVNANITDTRLPMAFAVPYLYGGASNTKGHLVPNQADGTIITSTDTATVSNAMLQANAAWGSWTPTYTNFAPGNGTLNEAKFQQVGKTVNFKFKFTGGTTTSASGLIGISLPVTAAAVASIITGDGVGDDGGGNTFHLEAVLGSTTRMDVYALQKPGTYISRIATSAVIPVTWGNGTILHLRGSFEAA